MRNIYQLKLVLALGLASFFFILAVVVCFCRRRRPPQPSPAGEKDELEFFYDEAQGESLTIFPGGQDLTIFDILEAPGEVIGKSNYGTLYKAVLRRSSWVGLLRFLRPVCASKFEDFVGAVRLLGDVRHPNLVPLLGFYSGPRGEKLLVHPFFKRGNLNHFIKDGDLLSHKWAFIYNISVGISKGLDFLHTAFPSPIIHGNLKSKNIFLSYENEPFVSDFGTHLLLNPSAAQEMLEVLAVEGYKAPEHMKMRDANEKTDVYSLGVIFLELLSGKQPVNDNLTPGEESSLLSFMENARFGRRLSHVYHPGVLLSDGDEAPVSEDRVIRFFELAMSCCAHSPVRRPNTKQILSKLQEIGR